MCRGVPRVERFEATVADGESGTTAGWAREKIAGCGRLRDEALQSKRLQFTAASCRPPERAHSAFGSTMQLKRKHDGAAHLISAGSNNLTKPLKCQAVRNTRNFAAEAGRAVGSHQIHMYL